MMVAGNTGIQSYLNGVREAIEADLAAYIKKVQEQ